MKFHRVAFPQDHTPRTFDRSLRLVLNPIGFDKGRNLVFLFKGNFTTLRKQAMAEALQLHVHLEWPGVLARLDACLNRVSLTSPDGATVVTRNRYGNLGFTGHGWGMSNFPDDEVLLFAEDNLIAADFGLTLHPSELPKTSQD